MKKLHRSDHWPIITTTPSKNDHPVEQMFGRDLLSLPPETRRRKTQRAFAYWRKRGFPYPRPSIEEAERTLELLSRVGAENLEHNLASPSMVGLRLANAFHPAIWDAKVRGKSPRACFLDDGMLLHALGRAPQLWPDRRCWRAGNVRQLIGLHNRSRVANFRPTVARALVDQFSDANGTVLDFSSGYGGRLLGTVSLPRTYIGIDAATAQANGLKRLASFLKGRTPGRARILHGPAEEILPEMQSGSVDLVLTSPPYFNKERYSREPDQSYMRYQRYENWRENFLFACVAESKRLLRRGGRILLNVADIGGHQIASDAKQICEETFGNVEAVLQLRLSSNPAAKSRSGKLYRNELILCCRNQ